MFQLILVSFCLLKHELRSKSFSVIILMKYILLILILFLVILHLRESEKETFALCKKIQKTTCHYLSKEYLPAPNYYMNPDNFMENILPLANSDKNKLYIKSHHIHNARKNLDYYFSKYNVLSNESYPEISKNKHIDLVYNCIKNKNLDDKIKIKMILTLFNLNNIDQASNHFIFVPYVLNEKNKSVNILTKNSLSIKIIGLYDLTNKRVDFENSSDIFSDNNFSYTDIDLNELFSETEIKEICKNELSILCKNNFEFLNNSLNFYKENQITISTTSDSNTLPDPDSNTCDIFSSQTEYLDISNNSFF